MSENPVDENARAFEVDEIGRVVYDKFDEGLRFIVMRGPASWCAYVGVPKDHPLAGFSYDDLPSVEAHGGLTFASEGNSKGSWPQGYYWYGWDYAHAGDVSVYDHDIKIRVSGPNPDYKDWTVAEVVKDSWDALYDFKKLVKFAEKITSPKDSH